MTRAEKIVLALAGSSHAFSHGTQLIFPAALPLLQKEFNLGYFELGVLGNVMFFTYGLGALPGGIVYNRLGPKNLYMLCVLGSAFALTLLGVSPGLVLFTAGLALLGALGSIYHPWANALITSRVGDYGRALGINGAAGNVGLALAPFAAGLLASRFGWRYAFFGFSLCGIALGLWARFVDMAPGRVNPASPGPGLSKASAATGLRTYFAKPLVYLYLANTFNGFCYFGSITFLPTYMAQRTSFHLFSLDSVAVGGMLSAVALLMGVFGQLAGGALSQRSRLERNYFIVSLISFPFLVAMSFFTNLLLLVLAVTYYFLNFILQPMNNTLLARRTIPGIRGTVFGIFFFISFCVGSLASSFSGLIAQRFGLQWVFLALSSNGLLLILFAYLYLKTGPAAHLPEPSEG